MPSSKQSKTILIVAAEASSALYAQRLLEFWRDQKRPVAAFGIGSPEMETLGFERLGRSEDLAVVGLLEVISHFAKIKDVFNRLVHEAARRRPDVVILMDYPDFNLRLAKKLKGLGFKVVYYISPQLWAWRKSRIKNVQKYIDQMIVLFPFEEAFYREHRVPVSFVGHPLLDELSDDLWSEDKIAAERARCGIAPDRLVLGLMPGSRRGEIDHHFDLQMQTAAVLSEKFPQLIGLLMVAPGRDLQEMKMRLPTLPFPIVVMQKEPFEMIRLADVVLCASGTATLMVALARRPMVIMYRFAPMTIFLARLIFKMPKFFGMVNLIFDREVVPEIFQERATPENLAHALTPLFESKDVRRAKSEELAELFHLLGSRGATRRVAEIIERMME